MITRTISGIVLALLVGAALFFGGPFLFVLLLAFSLIGMFEIYRIYKIEKSALGIIGYVLAIGYYVCVWFAFENFMLLSIAIALVLIMGAYVITYPKFNSNQAFVAFFAIVYVGVMLSFIYQIRLLEHGVYLVWLPFICSWVADTCAYFVGVCFGKHKMTPKLSPKKSVEGAIGGVCGAMIIGCLLGLIINNQLGINAPFVFTVACGVGALISIIGDLAASAIKRDHDVKDYGKLIPGHGGVMDRFDSTIFTAPAVYAVLSLLGAIG